MKNIIILSILSFVITSCATSKPNLLGKMTKADREAYMINLGKEATKAFGPGYYREYKQPIISKAKKYKDDDMRPEIQKNIGRKYYTVIFLYDPSKEMFEWDYASKVDIWQDTGEPKGVTFGNGYGKSFTFQSYEKQLHSPDKQVIPFQQVAPVGELWWKE